MSRIAAVSAFVILLSSSVGSFQTDKPAAPTIETLVAGHVAARGSAAAWNAVTSLQRHQRTAVSVDTAWRRAGGDRRDLLRVDQGSAEYDMFETRAFDGTRGWILGSRDDRWLSADEIQQLREDVAATVELLAAKELELTLSLAGSEMYQGALLWRVVGQFRSGRVLTFMLDAKTHLEVARVLTATAPDGTTREIWTEWGDYKMVNGIRFPHTANGRPVSYEVNKQIADDFFKKPGA